MGIVQVEASVGYLERLLKLPSDVGIIAIRYDAIAGRLTMVVSGERIPEAPEGTVAEPVVLDEWAAGGVADKRMGPVRVAGRKAA